MEGAGTWLSYQARFSSQVPFAHPKSATAALFLHYVPSTVAHLVSFKVRSIDALCRIGFLTNCRRRSLIAVCRVEMVIYVAPESIGAVKPRASPNEDAIVEPFWPVVASWGASIWSDIIVAIGTIGGYSDIYADLSVGFGSGSRQAESGHRNQQCKCKSAHLKFTSPVLEQVAC
jgi:hypothetical protein